MRAQALKPRDFNGKALTVPRMTGEGVFEVIGRAVFEDGAGRLSLGSNYLAVYQIRDGRARRPPASHPHDAARHLCPPALHRSVSANAKGPKNRYITYVFRDGKTLPRGRIPHMIFISFDHFKRAPPALRPLS